MQTGMGVVTGMDVPTLCKWCHGAGWRAELQSKGHNKHKMTLNKPHQIHPSTRGQGIEEIPHPSRLIQNASSKAITKQPNLSVTTRPKHCKLHQLATKNTTHKSHSGQKHLLGHYHINQPTHTQAMIGKNRQLVTNEPLEFEK